MDAKSKTFQDWLRARTETSAEIMTGIQGEISELRLDAAGLKARGWQDLPTDWVPEDGALAAGGYLEERAIYDSPVFREGSEEPRTLHLGLDIFARPGTPVFAPIEGYIHSFQLNAGALDYGPTIILQHEPVNGPVFWTLYGHLSEESLIGLDEGDLITRGEAIGELGSADINGGWAPHLHFQIMLDIGDRRGDFPGVCRKSEMDKWTKLCPDPRPLLGLF